VKRPGLKVRSRSGFFGTADRSPVTSVAPTPQAQLAKALVSPFTTPDLRVRLTTLFSNSEASGSHLRTLLHFDARDLTFSEEPDGMLKAVVDIAIVLFNENGDPIPGFNNTWVLRVPKDRHDRLLRDGFLYTAPVTVKKAGPYQLRVALRDATSQKLGSAMQFVEVPDLNNGRLALSGIVLAADPPTQGDANGSPAVRIFKSGSSVAYGYEVLNPYSDGSEKPALQMQIRLYRDGETFFEGAPSSLKTSDDKKETRVVATGRMQLTRIPAGDYVMQIVVFDTSKKGKPRVAVQAIDFEIRT
jgi:hypothetical protein